MNTKVKVVASPDGKVVVASKNNPEYGSVRVEQTRAMIDEAGFLRRQKVSAFIPGTVADLEGMKWANGQEIDGKIIIKESLEALNPKNPERDYKVAGETKIVCCVGGDPIYRKQMFTLDPDA